MLDEGERAQETITDNRRVLEEAGTTLSIEVLYFTRFVMQ